MTKRWTEAEERRLLRLIRAGAQTREAAIELHRSEYSTRNKIDALARAGVITEAERQGTKAHTRQPRSFITEGAKGVPLRLMGASWPGALERAVKRACGYVRAGEGVSAAAAQVRAETGQVVSAAMVAQALESQQEAAA